MGAVPTCHQHAGSSDALMVCAANAAASMDVASPHNDHLMESTRHESGPFGAAVVQRPGAALLDRVEALFPAPLAQFRLPDAEGLNARLVAEALARRAQDPGLARSNLHGWHSDDDFFERAEPGAVELCAHIIDAAARLTLQLSPRFDLAAHTVQAEGWINVGERGAMNTPHDHPGSVWSGSYYVQVPAGDKAGGEIEFLDPRTNIRATTVDGAACFASKYRLAPQAGQLLIFPSWLRHWVFPNESDAIRISVAFNLKFVASPRGAGP